jgi:tRNA (adenine22-N1)-methyltransferase
LELSKRLQAVARQVLAGRPAADIGADHALLAVHLVRSGRCPRVVVGELAAGPFERARAFVQREGVADRVSVRRGDGLEVLAEGEVATVIMAGLGGGTIAAILERAGPKAASFSRFVLQPQRPHPPLRHWLASRGWPVVGEEVVQEAGSFYVVLVAEPAAGPAYQLDELEMEVGPRFLQGGGEGEVVAYLAHEKARIDTMRRGWEQSRRAGREQRLRALETACRRLEEAMARAKSERGV